MKAERGIQEKEFAQVFKPFLIIFRIFLGEFVETVNISSQMFQFFTSNMSNVLEVMNECRLYVLCKDVIDFMHVIYSLRKIATNLQTNT